MDTATLVDLTHPLADGEVQAYPGDTVFTTAHVATVAKDGCSVHHLSLSSHTGTHIDAPSHFFSDALTLDRVPLAHLFGPLVLLDLTPLHPAERQALSWADLTSVQPAVNIPPGAILVVRTGWSRHWRTPLYYDHPFLTRNAADNIVTRGVRVLAMDTLSPDQTPYNGRGETSGFPVHHTLLRAGILIAENLTNLESITVQNTIAILPLHLKGGDGAPARVVAWKS